VRTPRALPARVSRLQLFLVAMVAVAVGGCAEDGPKLANVTGTVTMNGKPLAGALVEFTPQFPGSPSYGACDESGKYELVYSQTRKGAMIGAHTVRVSTLNKNMGQREVVPPEFNEDSRMTKEVEAGGDNVIDIEINTQ